MKKNEKIITYVLITLSFVLIFAIKTLYSNTISVNEEYTQAKTTLENTTKEHVELSEIDKKIKSNQEKDINFKWYSKTINDESISEYFYNYAKINDLNISWIEIWKNAKNDYGFWETKISLSATFNTRKALLKTLNDLINSKEFNFYIHDLNYSLETFPANITLPIKVLYK